MKTINQIKDEKGQKVSQLLNDCKVFFAFSQKQFDECKTELPENDTYVGIGAGGYMPKSLVSQFHEGMKNIEKWFRETVKANKARRSLIVYELYNYECFYIGDITDALNALGDDYTKEEVTAVYWSEYKKANA